MKAIATIALVGLAAGILNAAEAQQPTAWEQLTNAPRAEDVEDDGGFESPYFIEGDYAEGEVPTLIDVENFWDNLFHPVATSTKRVCNVSTKKCSGDEGYYDRIEIYVDLNGNKKGQYMVVYGNNRELWRNPVSTGVSGFRTTRGTFNLRRTNGGRMRSTRNHCSSVAEYGTVSNGVVNLAPMPYAVHFNGGEAFHAGYVTGKPESHGCVRQPKEYARALYCLLYAEDNWKRATVVIE